MRGSEVNINLSEMKEWTSALGFNYKAAIGEPLTQLCANAITGWGNKNNYHKKR